MSAARAQKVIISISFGTLLIATTACAAETVPASPPDFSGCWQNELGSKMELQKPDASGTIKGNYWTAVGNVDPSTANPVLGFVSGDVLGFCVHWKPKPGKPLSIACFTGQHTIRQGTEFIFASWLLNRDIPDAGEDAELWGANTTGANTFRLVAHASCK